MSQISKIATEEPVLSPYTTFSAHNDCVNGIRYVHWVACQMKDICSLWTSFTDLF
jgi:hypothetical protein